MIPLHNNSQIAKELFASTFKFMERKGGKKPSLDALFAIKIVWLNVFLSIWETTCFMVLGMKIKMEYGST